MKIIDWVKIGVPVIIFVIGGAVYLGHLEGKLSALGIDKIRAAEEDALIQIRAAEEDALIQIRAVEDAALIQIRAAEEDALIQIRAAEDAAVNRINQSSQHPELVETTFFWKQDNPKVQMISTTDGFCHLVHVAGKFEGKAEAVWIEKGGKGENFWYLGGRSLQSQVEAKARCWKWPKIN